jgi:hypothetical protein
MFLIAMTKKDVKDFAGFDWKAIGYITSIVSVFFLGAIAWPKPNDPDWVLPALIVGVAASVLGMGFRYLAHLQQKKEMAEVEAPSGRRELGHSQRQGSERKAANGEERNQRASKRHKAARRRVPGT